MMDEWMREFLVAVCFCDDDARGVLAVLHRLDLDGTRGHQQYSKTCT